MSGRNIGRLYSGNHNIDRFVLALTLWANLRRYGCQRFTREYSRVGCAHQGRASARPCGR